MIRSVDQFCQGVADLFADILYSGEEENELGDDETETEDELFVEVVDSLALVKSA